MWAPPTIIYSIYLYVALRKSCAGVLNYFSVCVCVCVALSSFTLSPAQSRKESTDGDTCTNPFFYFILRPPTYLTGHFFLAFLYFSL